MSSTDQERRDIDAGRTGDKVPFPDPAAAPLGTDEEAGGQRPAAGSGADKPALHGPAISDESGRAIDGALDAAGRRRVRAMTLAGLVLIATLGLAFALLALAVR